MKEFCSYAVIQLCSRAVMQSCSHAVMQLLTGDDVPLRRGLGEDLGHPPPAPASGGHSSVIAASAIGTLAYWQISTLFCTLASQFLKSSYDR